MELLLNIRLDRQAALDLASPGGATALMFAASAGNGHATLLLLMAGARADATDENGCIALVCVEAMAAVMAAVSSKTALHCYSAT